MGASPLHRGTGLAGWVNFAIWQLRHGLEKDMNPGPSTNSRAAIANERTIQRGPDLLRRCQLNSVLDKSTMRSYRAGTPYAGHLGLSLEDWNFWKCRHGQTRDNVGESAMRSIDEAVGSITAAETAL